jgi:hypothetical protein
MSPFVCSVCGQLLFFENSSCLRCGSGLGFDPDALELIVFEQRVAGEGGPRRCANQLVARCNWLVAEPDRNVLCRSCRLTSKRPNDNEIDAIAAFADAESAKRRLLYQLLSMGLPVVGRSVEEPDGVAFELLSSRGRSVTTGHEAGVITLDLSESDDAHREFVRQQLGEPYRTVLGHLRHEIAHYYWPRLVIARGHLAEFRDLFGDERVSYEDALRQHYALGPEYQWIHTHVSEYATMHPWEDWAETFAHYLHIADGVDTASSFGLALQEPSLSAGRSAWAAPGPVSIGPMMQDWLGLTIALNAMSRSIGKRDLYPFVLSPKVVEKLDFVDHCVNGAIT